MDSLVIQGGVALKGKIRISGAKNAALPLMCASLLTDQPLELSNLPRLADIATLGSVLEHLGVSVTINGAGEEEDRRLTGRTAILQAGDVSTATAPYDLVRKMRASILVLGPLVARCGHARVSLPGGCAIGNRPIDLHLKGLADMGAEIELADGYVEARAPGGRLAGGRVRIPTVSVGATENLMLAAALAEGETVIENAAREPEIGDLARCLTSMGVEIEGAGTDTLHIQGRDSLKAAKHSVITDRIEAGSYAVAAAITGGDITLEDAPVDCMGAVLDALQEAGAHVENGEDGLRVSANGVKLQAHDIRTDPYPGFPTDMQAQFMAMLSLAEGASVITETIFENRFMHVPELARMGADITVSGSTATVRGVEALKGAPVMATDLRASMSLVLAGLAAEEKTVINRIYHLDRGYERLEEKLKAVGARIERQPAESVAEEQESA